MCLSKFLLSYPVCQLNCLRSSNKLSLGKLIRRKRIYFSKHFAIILPLIFNELFGTNPN